MHELARLHVLQLTGVHVQTVVDTIVLLAYTNEPAFNVQFVGVKQTRLDVEVRAVC